MPKIDLSGTGAWQSKAGDKLKSLQNGNYEYHEVELIEFKEKTEN